MSDKIRILVIAICTFFIVFPINVNAFSNNIGESLYTNQLYDNELYFGGTVHTNCNTWWRTTTCTSNYVEDPEPAIDPAAAIAGLVVVLLVIAAAADTAGFVNDENNETFKIYNPFLGADIYNDDTLNVNALKVNVAKILGGVLV